MQGQTLTLGKNHPYQNCQLIPIGNPVGMNWIELVLSWRELVYIGILNFQLE